MVNEKLILTNLITLTASNGIYWKLDPAIPSYVYSKDLPGNKKLHFSLTIDESFIALDVNILIQYKYAEGMVNICTIYNEPDLEDLLEIVRTQRDVIKLTY